MSNLARRSRRASVISGLLVFLTLLILVRGAPIAALYAGRFRAARSNAAVAAWVMAFIALISLLALGIWKRPRATALAAGLAALALVVTSGNIPAFLIAAILLGLTLLTGDWVSRLFRGREAKEDELVISIAAGSVALGGALLLLGEAGLGRPRYLMLIAVVLILARRRRIPQLWSLSRRAARHLLDGRRSLVHALWLAIVVLVIAAGFLGSLRPDVSFDGIAYHLPEIRDFAQRGQVEPLANIDVTLLWRNYETFLGMGYLAGGEPVVRLLHFFVAAATFGSAIELARCFGNRGSGALALLVLAACPAVCAQLKETYVDLPAALFLTAAAVEITASEQEPRRLWLGGFLFGGAVTTKIFALFASVALFILVVRRHRASPRSLLLFALCAAIPLLPWLAWSQSRFGFVLSPYSDPWLRGSPAPIGGAHIPQGPETKSTELGAAGFLRFPYDRTFRSVLDGSGLGFLPLLLLVGVAGWGIRRFALFCAAALAALLPWHLLSSAQVISPSIRFLVPLYPLYAVFAALGIQRLTGNFEGGFGAAAAVSLATLSIALPAQFLSAPFDAQIALGRIAREQALSAYLPEYPLWRHLRPEDRVLFLGGRDRYYCPAKYILTDTLVLRMTRDPNRVRDLLRRLRITHIVSFDQRSDLAEFNSIAACVEEVDQHAPAVLYRFDWEKKNCPGPRVREAEGPRAFEGPAKAVPTSDDRPGSRRLDLRGGLRVNGQVANVRYFAELAAAS